MGFGVLMIVSLRILKIIYIDLRYEKMVFLFVFCV
jgi:hypothetical protein